MKATSENVFSKVKYRLVNVEGLVYVLSGSYLLFLAVKRRNFPLGLASGLLLIRGGSQLNLPSGDCYEEEI
jgi:hypothetical protein